jgi:hypothetical protein
MDDLFDMLLRTIDNTITNTKADISAIEGQEVHFRNGKINGLKVARLLILDYKNNSERYLRQAEKYKKKSDV